MSRHLFPQGVNAFMDPDFAIWEARPQPAVYHFNQALKRQPRGRVGPSWMKTLPLGSEGVPYLDNMVEH